MTGTSRLKLRRSTAPNSLSIWTHNIRGLQHHDRFVPTGCSTPAIPAISVAAGHRMGEIYDLAAVHGSMIIGGDDPDIGMGGYFTGGRNSLSPLLSIITWFSESCSCIHRWP